MSDRDQPSYEFGPFNLDTRERVLRREGKPVPLKPKVYETLLVLIHQNGHIVDKDELMKRVWPDVAVEENNLTGNIFALRKVFDGYQYIETVPRRGYRFTADLRRIDRTLSRKNRAPASDGHLVVGRDLERDALNAAWDRVRAGQGMMFTLAGEPGIGKSTLAEAFIDGLRTQNDGVIVARGRCSERLAGTEAYLPILEVLESLFQDDGRSFSINELMASAAPAWHLQIARSAHPDIGDAGGSQEQLKRQLVRLMQELAYRFPVVLFIDDLHWADASTVDLLSYLTSKIVTDRILLLGAYRPTDLLVSDHPFLRVKRDMLARGLCREVTMTFLTAAEIAEYLERQFPNHAFGSDLPALIHAKTEGNPLFMADLVRYLRTQGVINRINDQWILARRLPDIERQLPASVQAMIDQKIGQLTDDSRRLLTVASAQGYLFDSAVLAAVLKQSPAEVEELLAQLDTVFDFVREVIQQTLPDGTLTIQYRFVHALYQNALYGMLRPTRKAEISRALAETLERMYSGVTETIANNLAKLFEAARDPERAAYYFYLAARQASLVFASQEAVALARRGLECVPGIPRGRAKDEQELKLLLALGNALIATRGYASSDVETTYTRALDLCQTTPDTPHLLPALYGGWVSEFVGGRYRRSLKLGHEFIDLARTADPNLLVVGWRMVAWPHFCLGELEAAQAEFAKAIEVFDEERHRELAHLFGHDAGVAAHIVQGIVLWLLGRPEDALEHSRRGLELAARVQHANSRAFGLTLGAVHYQMRGETTKVRELTEEALALSLDQGFALWQGWSSVLRGWALVAEGGSSEALVEMRRGLDRAGVTGARLLHSYYAWLIADACERLGRVDDSMAALDEAFLLAEAGEGFWNAELHRLRGCLLVQLGRPDDARTSFDRAMTVARAQNAVALELRAVKSAKESS